MEFSEASQSLTTPHLLLFLISLVGMVFEKENRVPDKPKISMADMLKNKQKSIAEDKERLRHLMKVWQAMFDHQEAVIRRN
jgi:hypothetical protein